MVEKELIHIAEQWFHSKNWKVFPFQKKTWKAFLKQKNGIVNAATGSGKTYSLIIPILLEGLRDQPKAEGLRAVWLTPIRALAKEIAQAAEDAITGLGMDWQVGIRTGDTTTAERQKQKKNSPQILITTPESLHLLIASKNYEDYFNNLSVVVADEWHELVGSKRGVQVELALTRFRAMLPHFKTWGISATIGNLEEASEVLFGEQLKSDWTLIQSNKIKKIKVKSILPEDILNFPWAGRMGLHLISEVINAVKKSTTTLLFTNTRNQAEVWFHSILNAEPDFAGIMALHHGSIDKEQRIWVEQALHDERLKLVVCTSSLDLGVDFRPVETVIQIGSPKGVARFLQRAGRSGHQPGALSTIYLVPTHAIEIIEVAALQSAMNKGKIEQREPYFRSFDVLVQYLVTLSVSGGFDPKQIFQEIKHSFSYCSITTEEWQWILNFISSGGKSLGAYKEYSRVGILNGKYYIANRSAAMKHRLSIGTIVSDAMMSIRFKKGGSLGFVEERFITGLNIGDSFVFSGRVLELVSIKEMVVTVKPSKKKNAKTPAWAGGRAPLSSMLSEEIRNQMEHLSKGNYDTPELRAVKPILDIQEQMSLLPKQDELLFEYFRDKEGIHIYCYPFEGRYVHEGMSTLIAYRLGQKKPMSFSLAMSDYGFELLTDEDIDPHAIITKELFSLEGLLDDIEKSINANEMAKRKFRDIASISGLIFQGYPGKKKRERHLQSSAQLLFDVFLQYEKEHLLIKQAFEEVMQFQLEEGRMRLALERIQTQKFVIKEISRPSPLAFPILVDRLRERLTTESLEDRVKKMKLAIIK